MRTTSHLAVVLAPQAAELAEQRILVEPPLEVALGRAAAAEPLRAHRVSGPVLVDGRRHAQSVERSVATIFGR